MVKRLREMPKVEAKHIQRIECPPHDDTPLLPGRPLAKRRVAIISTAGLHKRGDRPFQPGDGSYRVIPAETTGNELAMSHILERQGSATSGIGLVREHTETVRPPRALRVTFELGRPLPALQPKRAASTDPQHKILGNLMLIPATERHRLTTS